MPIPERTSSLAACWASIDRYNRRLLYGLETLAAVRHFDKTILDLRNLNGIKLRKGTKGIHANWSRQRK
jgi:hypothetical protein